MCTGLIKLLSFIAFTGLVSGAAASPVLGSNIEALGGDKEGNGGDVFVTADSAYFLDLVRKPGKVVLDLNRMGLIKELQQALEVHDGYARTTYFAPSQNRMMSMQDKIISALRGLQFTLVDGPISKPFDQGDIEILWDTKGSIERLALQRIRSRKVLVDRAMLQLLMEKGRRSDLLAFLLHEALIRVYHDDPVISTDRPLLDTSNIAALVYATFPQANGAKQRLSAESVAQYLCQAKIPAGAIYPSSLKYIVTPPMPDTTFPRTMVAFAMNDEQCEVMQWRTHAAATPRPELGSEWQFKDITDEALESEAKLTFRPDFSFARVDGPAVQFYSNTRPGSIRSLTLIPHTPMHILRFYSSNWQNTVNGFIQRIAPLFPLERDFGSGLPRY